MIKEYEVEIFNELIKREPNFLDLPLEKLVTVSFIGEAALAAHKSWVANIKKLPMAESRRQIDIEDAQDCGIKVLAIEARVGELLPLPEDTRHKLIGQESLGSNGKRRESGGLPEGINIKKAYRARQIASHPKEVKEVVKEAIKKEEPPTPSAVMTKIKIKKFEEKHKQEQFVERPEINEVALKVVNTISGLIPKMEAIWKEKEYISEKLKTGLVEAIKSLSAIIEENE